jgi:hypothetical protein
MNDAIESYWRKKLEHTKENLLLNNFNAFIAEDEKEASDIFFNDIITEISPETISWGGSLTFKNSGIYEKLVNDKNFKIIDTYDKSF